MGKTLKGPPVSEDEVADAVATLAPAFEIIERRTPPGKGNQPLSAADNGQQRAFIVGTEIAFDPAAHDLGKASVDVYLDGEFQEKAFGNEVMESSPLTSIVWLVEQLAAYDRSLEAGSVVMTGSFTKQYGLDGPCQIEARFQPFGTVTAKFT